MNYTNTTIGYLNSSTKQFIDITFMIVIILIAIGVGTCISLYLILCCCKLVCCCIDEDLCRYLYNSCIFKIEMSDNNKEIIMKSYEVLFGSVVPITMVSKILKQKSEEHHIELV